jgi:hypothetical protein
MCTAQGGFPFYQTMHASSLSAFLSQKDEQEKNVLVN